MNATDILNLFNGLCNLTHAASINKNTINDWYKIIQNLASNEFFDYSLQNDKDKASRIERKNFIVTKFFLNLAIKLKQQDNQYTSIFSLLSNQQIESIKKPLSTFLSTMFKDKDSFLIEKYIPFVPKETVSALTTYMNSGLIQPSSLFTLFKKLYTAPLNENLTSIYLIKHLHLLSNLKTKILLILKKKSNKDFIEALKLLKNEINKEFFWSKHVEDISLRSMDTINNILKLAIQHDLVDIDYATELSLKLNPKTSSIKQEELIPLLQMLLNKDILEKETTQLPIFILVFNLISYIQETDYIKHENYFNLLKIFISQHNATKISNKASSHTFYKENITKVLKYIDKIHVKRLLFLAKCSEPKKTTNLKTENPKHILPSDPSSIKKILLQLAKIEQNKAYDAMPYINAIYKHTSEDNLFNIFNTIINENLFSEKKHAKYRTEYMIIARILLKKIQSINHTNYINCLYKLSGELIQIDHRQTPTKDEKLGSWRTHLIFLQTIVCHIDWEKIRDNDLGDRMLSWLPILYALSNYPKLSYKKNILHKQLTNQEIIDRTFIHLADKIIKMKTKNLDAFKNIKQRGKYLWDKYSNMLDKI